MPNSSFCYNELKNSLSADSPENVKKINAQISVYLRIIDYTNNHWDKLTVKELGQKVKAVLELYLGKSFS